MRLIADYHIHSKFSRFFHGKNTIEELVCAANSMGLKEIAITDHGFKHWCSTSKRKLKKARAIIDEINEWSSTKVLLGIEANIIAEDGTIDVDNETLAMLDILIVGYHKLIKTDFANYFGKTKNTKQDIQKCTNAFVNAIEKYPVTIVSHLDSILKTDLYQIGKACKDKGVFVEINSRHVDWNQEQIDELVASGCMFIVSSDAHERGDVGEVGKAFDLITKYQIPTENIVNVEFLTSEKSDNNLEIDAFYSMYKQKIDAKLAENREDKVEDKEENKLSEEMEKALKQIADEQGLEYNDGSAKKSEEANNDWDFVFPLSENKLIKESQDYQSQNSLKEFENQNEKLQELEEIIEEPIQDEMDNLVDKTETQSEIVDDKFDTKDFEVEAVETKDESKESVDDVKVEAPNANFVDIRNILEDKKPAKEKEEIMPDEKKSKTLAELVGAEAVLDFAVDNKNKKQETSRTVSKVTISKTETKKPTKRSAAPPLAILQVEEPPKAQPQKKRTPKAKGGFMKELGSLVADEKKSSKS